VDAVLPRRKCDVPAAATAALPDRKADQLESVERAADEMKFCVGELSRGIALVVRGDLDGDVVGLDGGLHGSAPLGNRDWFLREKSGTITRPVEDRNGGPAPARPGGRRQRG